MNDSGMKYTPEKEKQLMELIITPEMMLEPAKFVMIAYPWGEQGTPLVNKKGPRKWQMEELVKIGKHNIENQRRINEGLDPIPYNFACSSGRGTGKTTLFAWIAHWAASTWVGCSVIMTANTEQQLRTRTWAELGKWHTMSINNHWFERTATTLKPAKWFDVSLRENMKKDTAYYYIQAQLWSEENPDAFAGVHNENGVVLLFDEGSNIPASIWTVSEGFFTEPIFLRFWMVMSNPRRSQGAFFDCFHKDKDYWNTRFIDSRSVEGTDKTIYDKIIKKHGEDSDVARVEVKGQFPRTGSNQLIGYGTVEEAANRTMKTEDVAGSAKILTVDVARFGDDLSVIQKRQGLIAFEPIEFAKVDNMVLAGTVANIAHEWSADAIIIGSGGGQGVIDRLRQLGFNVIEVDEGGSADRKDLYLNKRIEMWDKMYEWLLAGGVIPNHERLKEDLSSPMYDYTPTSSKKVLESVDSMKKRGLPSPDFGTSLALSFSYDVAPTFGLRNDGMGKVVDKFDPFSIPATK
ncbi:MAG: terminase [Flammeovirgaceae bacterium]|nr:terminase [Flammeovirgaceae bacterium]